MPELSHDAAEDGFHEIQLSGKQIVFLFMVVTVASAVIFLCGVLVGRGVRSQRGEAVDNPPIASSSTAPQPAADAPPSEPPAPATETPDELSYHKRLQGESAPPETVKPEAPPPATPPPAAPQDPAPAAAEGARPGAWIVQVGAFGTVGAARDVVRKLAAKGHPAFLVSPAAGMPAIYRVQVGGYPSRSEADEVARRIEKEDQFKPVVRQNR
jgi:cell division septation protein DedD